MSTIVDLPLSCLSPGPNIRKTFTGIELLAATIRMIGLLQNLIVAPDLEKPGHYLIRGGERRYRAMKLLVSRKDIPADFPVPCRIITTDGDIEALAENEGHEGVPPWETGAGYCRLIERGMTQAQISEAVGRSQTHVSLCIRIHRGLAPKVIHTLERLGSAVPNVLELGRLAMVIDQDTLKPDEEKQLLWLQHHLCQPKKARGEHGKSAQILSRVRKLQDMSIPLEYVPVVEAIIRYITCVDDHLTLPRGHLQEIFGGTQQLSLEGKLSP